jgi:flagellar biosynthetic protein FliP
MMYEYAAGRSVAPDEIITRAQVPTTALLPAFLLSELKAAFIIGFRIYLPFLVIDMVISTVLVAMGMMMLPPVLISLPFKLLLFVLADGWHLIVGSLMASVVSLGDTS